MRQWLQRCTASIPTIRATGGFGGLEWREVVPVTLTLFRRFLLLSQFMHSALPPFSDPASGGYFRVFDASVLGLSTRTCSEWLQLAFQLKWVLGEVADIFARKYHTPIVNLLLRFETMYILLTLESYTEAQLLELESAMKEFVEQMVEVFGPKSVFNHGMLKPKLHALSHIVQWIRLFGRLLNFCTSHYEKAHTLIKDAAARTNNRTQEEMTMMRRLIYVRHLAATGHCGAFDALDQEQLEVAAAEAAARPVQADGSVTVQLTPADPAKAHGLNSTSISMPRALQPAVRQLLLQRAQEQETRPYIDMQKLRLYSALTISKQQVDGSQQRLARVHCRDRWCKKGSRYDDVLVQTLIPRVIKVTGARARPDAAAPRYQQQFARLEAIVSYCGSPLVFVRLYTEAANTRSLRIAPIYLKHQNDVSSWQLLPASAIIKRVQLMSDVHFRIKDSNAQDGRWFVNNNMSRCL